MPSIRKEELSAGCHAKCEFEKDKTVSYIGPLLA